MCYLLMLETTRLAHACLNGSVELAAQLQAREEIWFGDVCKAASKLLFNCPTLDTENAHQSIHNMDFEF
jgi:hypothetical protein